MVDHAPLQRLPPRQPATATGQVAYIENVHTLYLEDIELIHHYIGQHTNDIEMRTDEFIINNVGQIGQIPRSHIRELDIRARGPNVSLSCTPAHYRLSIESD